MNKYEALFIFRPDLNEESLAREQAKAEEILKKNGASVEKTDQWGKKRLTFEIEKVREGFFVYIEMQAPPEAIAPMTEACKLENAILRVQFVRKNA